MNRPKSQAVFYLKRRIGMSLLVCVSVAFGATPGVAESSDASNAKAGTSLVAERIDLRVEHEAKAKVLPPRDQWLDSVEYAGYAIAAEITEGEWYYIVSSAYTGVPLPEEVESLGYMREGVAVVGLKDGGDTSFLTANGQYLEFTSAMSSLGPYLRNGLARFEAADGKEGMLGMNGTVVVPPQYCSLASWGIIYGNPIWMRAGRSVPTDSANGTGESADGDQSTDARYGYIIPTGDVVIPIDYTDSRYFDSLLFLKPSRFGVREFDVVDERLHSVFDRNMHFDFAQVAGAWILVKQKDGKTQCFQRNGNPVTDPFDRIFFTFEGLSAGMFFIQSEREQNAKRFVNFYGEERVFSGIRKMGYFYEDYPAPFTKDGKLWGYVDRRGEVVIKPKFLGASDFLIGLAAVRTRKGIRLIDRTGEEKFLIRELGPLKISIHQLNGTLKMRLENNPWDVREVD